MLEEKERKREKEDGCGGEESWERKREGEEKTESNHADFQSFFSLRDMQEMTRAKHLEKNCSRKKDAGKKKKNSGKKSYKICQESDLMRFSTFF